MLSNMPDEFIPEEILSKIVIIESDISEYKGYEADLSKNNDKNDLNHTIKSVNINESGILSSGIYTDVNKSRQNPYLKLISIIHKLWNDSSLEDNSVKDHSIDPPLVITYNLYNDRKLLND